MRILNLEVEQYGVFSQREFEFGSGRFQLICGPNEAGKSTLLQLIRESLFGFPHQSPYRFSDVGEMASTVRMVMASGRELRFRRRKGTKDPVVGQWIDDGAAVDETQLQSLLGASQALFQSVFAFSLAELSSGQKSLEQAQLTEALFGGAIGGLARFQSLNKRIHEDANQLFTHRSSKRKLNLLLSRIDQLQTDLENVASRPDDYQQLVRQHAKYEAEIRKLTELRSRTRDVRHESQRMCDAWPSFVKLQSLKRQQTGGGKLKLTTEQWQEAEQLRDLRQRLRERIREQEAVIKRREPQKSHWKSKASDNILAQESQVQAMVQETGRMHDFAEQLPLRKRELEEATGRLRERLRNLDLHWDLHRLEQVPDDQQMHQRLLRESRELNEKRRQLEEIRRVERQHRLQLQDVKQELAAGNGETGVELPTGGTPEGWEAWDEWDAWDGELGERVQDARDSHDAADSGAGTAVEPDSPATPLSPAPANRDRDREESLDVKRRPFDALDSMDPLDVEAVEVPQASGSIWEPLDDISLEGESFSGPDLAMVLTEEQLSIYDQLIDRESADRAARIEMQAIDRQRQENRQRRQTLKNRMEQMGAWRVETAPVDETQVIAFRQQGQQLEHRLTSAARRVEEVQRTLNDHQHQATQFQHAPPDDDQLRALRTRRDDAWALIRRHFIDQASQEPAIRDQFQCDPLELVAKLPQLVEAADVAADVRQDQASVVAEMKALRAAVQKHQQQLADARLQQQAVEKLREDHQSQWQAFWEGGPDWDDDNILAWLKCRDEVHELSTACEELDRRWQTLADFTTAYEQELREALRADAATDLDTLRVELRERMRRHQIWEARREHLQLRSRELSVQLEEAVKDEARIASSVRQSELAWEDLRQRMKLPDAWAADTIVSQVSEIAAAKADGKRIRELEKTIDNMQAEIDAFRARVERIAGESDEDRSALDTLHKLSERLEQAQHSKQQLSAQQAEDQRLTDELERMKHESEAANRRWETLRKLAGVESDEAFIDGLNGASVHQQLEAAQSQVIAALACDDRDRAKLLFAELERSSQAELERRLEDAKKREAQVDDELSQLHKEHGASRNRLQQVDASDRAAEVEMERQSALAELAEVVDQWAPLKLAAKLMEQALDRFERNHQPALLEEVGRLYRKMTDNAYVEIRRQLDKHGTLLAVDSSGNVKTPDQLSTGAREQLYLAIRLAYVKHYCQTAEPLPLVLDDVLVNFDEARAKRTIDTLVEMSDDLQILMLTCHKQTARLVYQQCSGMQPILLSRDPSETLESWIKSPSSRTRRRRPSPPSSDAPQQGILFPKG